MLPPLTFATLGRLLPKLERNIPAYVLATTLQRGEDGSKVE